MEEEVQAEIPICKVCHSKQIRTTKTHRICIRCGYKESIE